MLLNAAKDVAGMEQEEQEEEKEKEFVPEKSTALVDLDRLIERALHEEEIHRRTKLL